MTIEQLIERLEIYPLGSWVDFEILEEGGQPFDMYFEDMNRDGGCLKITLTETDYEEGDAL